MIKRREAEAGRADEERRARAITALATRDEQAKRDFAKELPVVLAALKEAGYPGTVNFKVKPLVRVGREPFVERAGWRIGGVAGSGNSFAGDSGSSILPVYLAADGYVVINTKRVRISDLPNAHALLSGLRGLGRKVEVGPPAPVPYADVGPPPALPTTPLTREAHERLRAIRAALLEATTLGEAAELFSEGASLCELPTRRISFPKGFRDGSGQGEQRQCWTVDCDGAGVSISIQTDSIAPAPLNPFEERYGMYRPGTTSAPYEVRGSLGILTFVVDKSQWWVAQLLPDSKRPAHAPLELSGSIITEDFTKRAPPHVTISPQPFGSRIAEVLGDVTKGREPAG